MGRNGFSLNHVHSQKEDLAIAEKKERVLKCTFKLFAAKKQDFSMVCSHRQDGR